MISAHTHMGSNCRRSQVPFLRHSSGPRAGKILWALAAIMACLSLLVWLLVTSDTVISDRSGNSKSHSPLMVYCAASNKSVMEVIRADYESEFGRQVQVQYGPSQTLLASLEVSRSGDLYLPADDSYLKMATSRSLVSDEFPLAKMRAVIAVPKGNPLGIRSLSDVHKNGVRLAQANPEAAAIGKLTKEVLSDAGTWDALEKHTVVFKSTVNDVASDVKLGAVDCGIVYDAVLHDYDSLEGVEVPELSGAQAQVSVGVLKVSSQPREAVHFARFLSSRDKGLVRYREFGFQPADGDIWSETPELTLYAGSMLRPAIEETIAEFEQREGVQVTRVYNGCGILVAQMKSGHVPDAYFACDTEFMEQVKDLFPKPESISQNELVIIVRKGNPLGIKSLKDLVKPGLRIGIGHEKQCAMGWITQRTFVESGLQSKLMSNVVVQTPTGDMLVNQMRSGSLDAAVVYLSNAAGSAHELDAIRIQGIPCSVATQPYGVARNSKQQQLSNRLLRAIQGNESHEIFTSQGFRWLSSTSTTDE